MKHRVDELEQALRDIKVLCDGSVHWAFVEAGKIADKALKREPDWEAACKHDGVNPKSMFVVFSEDNPHT